MLGSGTKVAQAVLRAELRKTALLRLPISPSKTILHRLSTFEPTRSLSTHRNRAPHPHPRRPISNLPPTKRTLKPPSVRDRSNIRPPDTSQLNLVLVVNRSWFLCVFDPSLERGRVPLRRQRFSQSAAPRTHEKGQVKCWRRDGSISDLSLFFANDRGTNSKRETHSTCTSQRQCPRMESTPVSGGSVVSGRLFQSYFASIICQNAHSGVHHFDAADRLSLTHSGNSPSAPNNLE